MQLILFLLNILKKLVRTMHTKSNIEIKMDSKTDDTINKLFEFFFFTKRKNERKCIYFWWCDLLYHHLQRTSLKRSGSQIDSPIRLFNKKATINPKSKNNHCFKHSLVAAEHWEKIDNHPERFFRNYSWKDVDFPATSNDKGKSLNKIIRQLLLISYLYSTILKK